MKPECKFCKGEGYLQSDEFNVHLLHIVNSSEDCPYCDGTGFAEFDTKLKTTTPKIKED